MAESAQRPKRTERRRDIAGPLLTLGVAAVIELLSRTSFKIPNPPAFLLLMVVFSAFQGGLRAGLISAVIAWTYFAYYFSIPQQPFHYTNENLRRILVWLVTTPAIALMVGVQRSHIERMGEAHSRDVFDESLRRYAERLKILHETDQAILAAQLPEAVADAALRGIWQLVPYRRATIGLFDFGAKEYLILVTQAHGHNPVTPGTRIPMETLGDLDRMLEALRQNKVHRHDLRALSATSPVVQAVLAEGVHHFTVVPLMAQGQLLGSLNLGEEGPGSLTPEHIDIAREVADQLAVAIQQARMREELHQHTADLERQVAEQTKDLREAREFLEILISMSPSMMFEADLTTGRVTYNSANIESIIGYKPEDVQNMSFWEGHVHPDDRQVFNAGLHGAVGQRKAQFEVQYRFRHKDSHYVWLHSAVRVAYDQAGQPTTIFGYTRDIAESKAAEDALKEAQHEADRANEAKSEFLSRMSHELRTPLNAILGFGQLLEMEDPSPEHQKRVGQILKAGRHLLDLINEVLEISRIEAGRLALSPEAVHVGDVLQEVIDLIQPLAAQRSCQVISDLAPWASQHVLADRQRLKQALLNLLSNAVKYNREGGTVSIACGTAAANRLRISVIDTGLGIPPGRIHELFTPFMRLHTESTEIEGTGLGLALSKRLVEAMGGEIGVESRVGRGSTFWVELPLAEAPVERLRRLRQSGAELAGSAAVNNGGRRTVLYIEDNLSNVTLIEDVLRHRPALRLLTAMQGRLGLDLAGEHRPDVVLLDLHLPDMNGADVLHELRQNPKTHDIPVVVISADATPGQIRQLTAAGCRAYLTKPLDVRELLTVLDDTLNGVSGLLDTHRVAVNHPTAIYLIDPAGDLRLSYNAGGPAEDIAHDIRRLLEE